MAQNMDLVDIEENLKYRNANAQCTGFTALVTRIFNENPEEKLQKTHHKLFFDCWFAFGDAPFEMLLDTLPVLREKRFTKEEYKKEHFQAIFDAFSARITKIERIRRAFSNFVDVFQPNYSNFLLLSSKIPQEALLDVFSDVNFYNRHLKRITVLLFTDILSPDQKRQLGNDQRIQGLFLPYFPKLYPNSLFHKAVFEPEQFLRVCSQEELKDHSLEGLNIFQKLKLAQERQNFLKNMRIRAHALYLPFLFEMNTYRNDLLTLINPFMLSHEVLEVRTLISVGQEQFSMIQPDFSRELNLETYLGHVVNNEKIPTFVRFIEHFPDCVKMLQKPNILPLLTILLIHTKDEDLQKRICRLLVNFLKKVPEQADGYVKYFTTLVAQPFFPISRGLVVETITDFAVNRHIVPIVINFLTILVGKKLFQMLGLENFVKLVRKYPTIVGSIVELLDFPDEGDSEEVFLAKLNLAKECCIATDDNDEVLSKISNLLTGSGSRLASTIDVILEFVKNDVLELKQVRRQLARKVSLPGNIQALVAYCRLLALGAIPNSEESDETNHELKMDCIKDLYELTKYPNKILHPEVVSESWRSLGDYDVADIEEAVGLPPSAFGAKYIELYLPEQDGFIDFLTKVLSREVDSYQRPLYNSGQVQAEIPPLLAKIDTYKDQLLVKNKDEVWFWSATLPLCGSILQLAAPSNKALQAVRLVKSCLLNVPESSSNEDMLRLMAGWRICVREALTVLADSKNNDLLWARDQIAQEGRLCLTQKSESVDNIMMMLTVLVEVVEEKLRVIDDQKLVDEVSKAQKPWIISVFEFIATRLPKGVKQRREQKCNPIYQVLTHSNKSSLFIAIFCTRLLYRNPSILEFYGDGAELELLQDRLFISLLQDSSLELRAEEVPDRKMLWITTEAYGVDEMTAKSFEAAYQVIIDEKTEDFGEPTLENDLEVFFKALASSPKDVVSEAQQKSRKALEKMWNNGTEDQKRQIYEGLSELALTSGSCRKRAKTIPIDRLPDSSALKGVLTMFDERHNVDVGKLRKLIRCFTGQKRKDGRFLPPVDWLKILERVNWKDPKVSRLPIVTLACEQNISEVLFHVASELTIPEVLVVAEHLAAVSKLLPRKQFEEVLRQLIRHARSEKNLDETALISESIALNQKLPIVRLLLAKTLPTLESTIEVTDSILKALKDPEAFGGGLVSSCFDVWLEAKNGERMNVKRICDTISAEEVADKRVLYYGLISHEARKLSIKKRFEKILDVVTVSRISRSTDSDLSFHLPLILSLIVSPTDNVDLPVCWFDNEDVLEQIMLSAAKPFFKVLVEHEEMKNNVKHIASFLRPYIDSEEATMYADWQRAVARDFLLQLIAAYPRDAIPDMLHESDTFWKTILPV